MKFFATLLILCAIAGFALAQIATTSASTTTSAPAVTSTTASPCGDGPLGPCGQSILPFLRGSPGKKVYLFFK